MAIIGNAYVAVHAITTGFKNDVDRSLNGLNQQFSSAGNRAATAFSRGLSGRGGTFKQFEQEALRANNAFASMVRTGYALGPAISVAVGGLSSLVSGFVALTMQVGAAIPSLIVLPGILAAIGQAALVAKLAFGGIGKALGQLARTGGGGGGGDNEAAEEARKKRIENAEKNLARVLESNREALTRANRNLADAEERLTEARKEAAESLQQLNFDAEDAAISEKKAALQLERARETLARVQDLPPNSRARREAELAYAEADLNLRRAKDRNQDLAKATEEANKKGVEGSDQVVQATRDVQDARDELARTERDGLRAQVDAEEQLADARKETAKAGAGGGGADAFDKLSEAAKAFALFLVSLKPKLEELRDAAQKYLLPSLQLALQNLVDNLFPRLIPIVEQTGLALGKAAIDFSNFITEGKNLEELTKVASTNNYVIGNLGIIFGNLYDAMLSLLTAADPLIKRFTDWIVTLTTGWKETLEARNATGELTDTFNYAGDVAAQLGRVFGNIWDALKNIAAAAAGPGSAGESLLTMFEQSTQRFKEFTGELLASGRLEEFFNNIAVNAGKVSSLVVDIVKEFLKLGENKAIGETADSLRTGFLPVLSNILNILQGGAPALTEFMSKLGDFLLKFTETDSINTFFGVLGKGLDVLNAIFSNELVMKVVAFTAPIMGTIKALSLMSSIGGFAFKVMFGYIIKAKGLFNALKVTTLAFKMAMGSAAAATNLHTMALKGNKLAVLASNIVYKLQYAWLVVLELKTKLVAIATKIWSGIQAVFNAIMSANPIALIIIGIMALIAAIVLAYKKFGWFRDAVHAVLNAIKVAFTAVWTGIKAAFDFVWNAIKTAITLYWNYYIKPIFIAFKTVFEVSFKVIKAVFSAVWDFISAAVSAVWDAVIKPIFEAFAVIFSNAWEIIKVAFLIVWKLIEVAIQVGWALIKVIFEAMRTVFSLAWDGIKIAFSKVWDIIKTAIQLVWNTIIKPVFEAFLTVFKLAWDGIKSAFDIVWNAIKDAINFVWNNAIKPVFEAMKTVFTAIWDGIRLAFETIWNGMKTFVARAWDGIKVVVEVGVKLVTGVFDWIKNAWETVWNALGGVVTTVFGGVKLVVYGVVNTIIGAVEWLVNKVIDGINLVIKGANLLPGVDIDTIDPLKLRRLGQSTAGGGGNAPVPGVDYGGMGGPTYTGMAEGGIVPARRGGMLALIGEAGRAERVEPLDEDGLSKRDKAMIQMLSSPNEGGGITLNVYPSKGMDEAELAAMISRQLAFQLRRGAA